MNVKSIKKLPKEFDFISNLNPLGIIYHAKEEKYSYVVTCCYSTNTSEYTFTKKEFRRHLFNDEFEIYNLADLKINKIIEKCNILSADEEIVIPKFGKNKDLTLYIHKDCEYNPKINKDSWNLVTISTKQNNNFVDDTGDIHVTDGSLYNELKRIYKYQNFKTL